jgi:O-acetyl-ADP-ribose deacetylase (regulator of RNase III)
MRFTIIHPDREQLKRLRIAECDHIRLLTAFLEQISPAELRSGKFGIVAPGNSFGLMDGGYDQAIVNVFGQHVQDLIKEKIATDWNGLLPVGHAISCQALIAPLPDLSGHVHFRDPSQMHPFIIYAPTMQIPMDIRGTLNAYHATRAAIREGIRRGCENLLLPLMGAGTGLLPHYIAGKQIQAAINESRTKITAEEIDWDYAVNRHNAQANLIRM